jgi:hypothetical protein
MQPQTNILYKDKNLDKLISISESRIPLPDLLKLFSSLSGRKITSDPQFKKDYIAISCKNIKISNLMDGVSSIWLTYWEKQGDKYTLRKMFHHADASNVPGEREREEGLDAFMQEMEKLPSNQKALLGFSEGQNPNLKCKDLPAGMQESVAKIVRAQITLHQSKRVKGLEANLSDCTVGFRILEPDDTNFRKTEFMIFRGTSFLSMQVPNIIEQKRIQDRALNSPNAYHSRNNNRFSETEMKEKVISDPRLRKLVSLNTGTVNPHRAWMDLGSQVPELSFICYSYLSSDDKGKIRLQFSHLPLKDAADKIVSAITKPYVNCMRWELRRSGVMVLRANYGPEEKF